MKRAWVVVGASLALVVLVVGGATAFVRRHNAGATRGLLATAPLRAPEGVRIRVQVLNATKTHGLARRATMLLRDRGFDVVETGTLSQTRDTSLVLDLSGHPEWAQRIAKILAPATVTARTDSSRYLDIAVIVGNAWRPPTQPFYP
jgi:hypothetical protein